MIVCWEHDWPEAPRHLEIVEIRRFFDLGRNVWIQPAIPEQWHWLDAASINWAVSKRAQSGDLLLMYRCSPISAITDVYRLAGALKAGTASWRDGDCYYGPIRRVCKLSSPVFLADLRAHRVLSTSPFVRRNMQGNLRAREYWPHIYDVLVNRNASERTALAKFRPKVL